MQRLELQSVTELMHLYQAAMAGKFEGSDKSLLLSEPLAQALLRLVESIIASARGTHNEPMVDSMLDGLKLKEDYPQYQLITQAFSEHHEELSWHTLETDTKLAYLKTAIKPLTATDALLNTMLSSVDDAINTTP
ncbi:MAG: hypothetical protein KAG18_06590 [Sinobacterium sp.]|nr:hypothetical protein [Sinobacterium sp.]